MNQNENTPGEFLKLPASALSGFALAEALHAAINHAHGHQLTYKNLAAQLGEPVSTTHRWFASTSHPHLRTMVYLLELMSSQERQQFWDAHCRELPTLQHPRLAHDPYGVAQLAAVLQTTNGLLWLSGGAQHCSFVLHALGHSYQRSDIKHRAPVGISAHSPASVVPLAHLIYLAPLQSRAQQKVAAQHALANIKAGNSTLLLLDGISPSWFPEDLLTLAQTRKVIITGAPDSRLLAIAKDLVMHVAKVSAPIAVSGPLTVRVSAIEA